MKYKQNHPSIIAFIIQENKKLARIFYASHNFA